MKDIPGISLGELLKLERRPVKVVPDSQYAEIGIYCFGRGIFHKLPRSGFEVGNKDLFLIKEGDFILQVTFAWEGAVGLASSADDGMYGSTRFPTFRVDESRCFPSYLVNYFKTHEGREQLVKISPGSAGRNRVLSLKRIPEVFVPLPPLSEQCRIVARIEGLTAKIKEARMLRQKSLEEVEALLPSTLELLYGKEVIKKWPQKKLIKDKLATVIAGQHIMAGEYNSSGNGVPYLTGPADFGLNVPEVKRWTLVPKSMALPGDVLLTVKGAGVGKINYAPNFEVAIGRQLMAIRPDLNNLLSQYVYFFLDYKFKHFQSISTATTVPGFKKTDVEDLNVPVPPLPEQRRIVTYLDNLQAKVNALKHLQAETEAELDALLPSILDKAFKGKL